jgi:hypothetical protein
MPIKREIVYPIFLKAMTFSDDIFWKEIFEELAYGIAPYGTYINKGVLCCNQQNSKDFVYRFLDKDPKKIYEDITKLLKKNNLMSKNDRKIILSDFNEAEKKLQEIKNIEWANIKKKSLKDTLFQNFLISSKKKYNLKDSQIKKVYNFINLGIMLKTIKPSDINYKNGEILSINGISFSENSFSLNFDIYEGIPDNVEEELYLDENEKKFLKDL